MQNEGNSIESFHLKPFQSEFIYSDARFPALIAGWGSGKTMCGIMRGIILSEKIKNNSGLIVRREFTDLRDSTIKDFQDYTGIKVPDSKNVSFPNGSKIMFRHGKELDVLKNINVSWFMMEQAEEFDSDEQFQYLRGRIRKGNAPFRTGFVIGNVNGHNWIWKLWKSNPQQEFMLREATSFDNADNLPEDTIADRKRMEKEAPTYFRRFIMNDWESELDKAVFRNIELCIGGMPEEPKAGYDYIIGVDLAKSQDYTVLAVLCRQTKHLVAFQRFNQTSWYEQRLQISDLAKKYHNALVVIDSTGVGDPIAEDLQHGGVSVKPYLFTNTSKQALVEKLKVSIEQRLITFPDLPVLVEELRNFQTEVSKSGNIKYSAPQGSHDDCVIALGLATCGMEGLIYGSHVERRQPNYHYRKPEMAGAGLCQTLNKAKAKRIL